jgi:enoyl-CoA hydratase/carnithine racemase
MKTIGVLETAAPLSVEISGNVATVRLRRSERANALNEAAVTGLGEFFAAPPAEVRAAVLTAEGAHFCAGLDLAEHRSRSPFEAMEHSRLWHATFDRIEHGRVPVVAVLRGAVIGGGLELALTAHVRLADPSVFYSLPEGRLGIFVGGGGAVRIGRLLGADRMREMMLTGRRLSAEDGDRLGMTHEIAAPSELEARANELARQIAANAPLTNQLILAALPRVSDMSRGDGLWAEALTTALTQSTADAHEGLQAFLEKRAPIFHGT